MASLSIERGFVRSGKMREVWDMNAVLKWIQ